MHAHTCTQVQTCTQTYLQRYTVRVRANNQCDLKDKPGDNQYYSYYQRNPKDQNHQWADATVLTRTACVAEVWHDSPVDLNGYTLKIHQWATLLYCILFRVSPRNTNLLTHYSIGGKVFSKGRLHAKSIRLLWARYKSACSYLNETVQLKLLSLNVTPLFVCFYHLCNTVATCETSLILTN